MEFNSSKCFAFGMHISRNGKHLQAPYVRRGYHLAATQEAKYLGVTITEDLSWTRHTNLTAAAASKTLGFLRRNLRTAPCELKEAAYKVLVRPKLEYANTVWAPYRKSDKSTVEKVQRRAARFVTGRHRNRSSVSDMLEQLGWESLEQRALKSRATMAFKIRNQLVAIPAAPYLTCPDAAHSRQSRSHTQTVPVPYARTDYLKYSFFYRAPVIWNSLPQDVIDAASLDSFKSRLAGVTLSPQ
jgi:hypothetical protein